MSQVSMNYPKLIIILLLCLSASNIYALPSDREQPIKIVADSAIRDEKLGITIYQGNVEIQQGTLLINADKVTIRSRKSDSDSSEELDEMIAVGQLATLKQQLEENGEFVDAAARTLRYKIDNNTVELIDEASLKQQGSTISGDRITYDMHTQRVKARGEVNSSEPPERVTVIIPPKQNKPDESKSDEDTPDREESTSQ